MRTSTILFICLWLNGVLSENSNEKKVKVDVYFESLCPDSYSFIKKQLHPNFKELAPYVDLKLVPFGKSSSQDNGTSFTCHHGPGECQGNKVLSCALSKLPDQISQVEFTTCFMDTYGLNPHEDEKDFGQKCAQLLNLKPETILDCYNSQEGINYQLSAEHETLEVKPKFVPTIIFNKVFNQKQQDDSLSNFKGVVCTLLESNQPEVCQEPLPIIPL